jgi:hypothetical protein
MSEISRDMFRRKKWGDAHGFFFESMICVKTRAAETEADHFDLFVTEALEWPLAYMAYHWHPWLPGAEKQFHNVSQSSTVRQLDHLSLSGTSGGCWCSCSSERWRRGNRRLGKHTEESPRIMGNHVTECPEIRGKCGLTSKQLQLTHTR